MSKIEVKKLPRGEFTDDGAYFAQVDEENVGLLGRAFWRTHEQAKACAIICVAMRDSA